MVRNLTEIQDYLKNKNICLLGNSKSILKSRKDIDSFDIVCRINRGTPKGKEVWLGSRTDVLFLATHIKGDTILKDFNPKFIVWTTNDIRLSSGYVKDYAIQNPDWQEVKDKLQHLPSTGCVALYFLLKHIEFDSLTIYGFDFFQSGTWYHNMKTQPWHSGELEESFIHNLIKDNSKIRMVIE